MRVAVFVCAAVHLFSSIAPPPLGAFFAVSSRDQIVSVYYSVDDCVSGRPKTACDCVYLSGGR